MHDPESSHHELKGFEARLAALTPRARLDRDCLMFAAGRRAGARPLRVANRLLATASLTLAAVVVVVAALPRLPSEPDARIDLPPADQNLADGYQDDSGNAGRASKSLALADGPTHYRLRQLFADGALGQLPEPAQRSPNASRDAEGPPPSRLRSLLNQYLNNT